MKAAVYDLETTALEAVGAGWILCGVVKPLGGKPKVFRADDYNCKPGREKPLLAALLKELSQYDLWIGHNSERFDYQYIKSRLLALGLPNAPRPFSYDTMKAFKRRGYLTVPNFVGKPTARLGHVVDFFGYRDGKTGILPNTQWTAVWGNDTERQKAMDFIVSHCKADVIMTEQIYWELIRGDDYAVIRRLK